MSFLYTFVPDEALVVADRPCLDGYATLADIPEGTAVVARLGEGCRVAVRVKVFGGRALVLWTPSPRMHKKDDMRAIVAAAVQVGACQGFFKVCAR